MSGARIARRTRATPGQRVRAVAPPVAAALLLALAFVLPGGSDADRPPAQVKVARSTYACPGGAGFSVAAGQVVAGTSATAQRLPDRKAVESLTDAQRWRRAPAGGSGVVVDQRGRASGAVGFYAGAASKRDGGGLVIGSCPATVDDSWYVGVGSGAKHLSTVILTNLSSAPAVADLSFWGPEGRVDAIDAGGIVVDPYTVRRVDLSALAAGEAELAVRVERRRGSLAVAAVDRSTAVFRGTEAMAPTTAPRRQQVVGGIPRGTTGRTLLLLNPTTSTARVSVRVVGAKGTFAPKGLESVKLGAGRLRTVTVPRSVGADAAALRLQSDQPVAASVRVSPSAKDRIALASTPPLDGPAVVPVDLGVGTKAPTLVLSAPGHAGGVTLEAYDRQMKRLGSSKAAVDAGTTTSVDLASAKGLNAGDAAYVVVRAQGMVVGAATYVRGGGVASLALTGAPVTVLGPQVRPAS